MTNDWTDQHRASKIDSPRNKRRDRFKDGRVGEIRKSMNNQADSSMGRVRETAHQMTDETDSSKGCVRDSYSDM